MTQDTTEKTPTALFVFLAAMALCPFEYIYCGLGMMPGIWLWLAAEAFLCYQLFKRKAWAWWVLTLILSLTWFGNVYDGCIMSHMEYNLVTVAFVVWHSFLVYQLVFTSIRPWALRK